ncbi:LOW QUALITY PROTEIN: Hypothetical protein PHPALM_36799 [Phytophthora palmivora]|uniref:Integrase catalytic domain-containing protein n=1 Tax=Phytophthora palmivora TaxID=4796 RepID=A0A2P4WZ16_9STRA|nr:LOW QUALITY PROTEIN: Hypothetical protein PHPALM_36799 [Phytophthora palmivora]
MTPIFNNILIDCSDESIIGKQMFDNNEKRKQSRSKPDRKLISSYFGEKIQIYTTLLKWYLAHGMEITQTYSFIKASSHKAFALFVEAVSNARREDDTDKSKAMIAEMTKLVGNSAFGRSVMDTGKHKEIKYESDDKAVKIEHFTFHELEELNDSCEITMKKRRLNNKNPIHLSIAIYQLAKLLMLQFYYDCIDFYFDRSDFQYQEMDTDKSISELHQTLRKHFNQHKFERFPRAYNDEVAKFDRRTPGLFKDEWSGDVMVSLPSNNYICYPPDESYKIKVSAKGVQLGRGRNNDVLNPDGFETDVRDRITLQDTNKGFRLGKETKSIITYCQTKTAISYFYDKRREIWINFCLSYIMILKQAIVGAQALYHKAKVLNHKITYKNVKNWYHSQTDLQRFQEQKKRFDGIKIASYSPKSWQIELALWDKKPILTAININSRLGYAKLLSNKTAPTVLTALKAFVQLYKLLSRVITELMNAQAQIFIKLKKIEHFNKEAGDRRTMRQTERFNRTIKQRLTKIAIAKVF